MRVKSKFSHTQGGLMFRMVVLENKEDYIMHEAALWDKQINIRLFVYL